MKSSARGHEQAYAYDALVLRFSAYLSRIFTKERINLVNAILIHNPRSLQHLATILKRDIAAVSRDVRVLARSGVLSIEKQGRKLLITVNKSAILILLKEEGLKAMSEKPVIDYIS